MIEGLAVHQRQCLLERLRQKLVGAARLGAHNLEADKLQAIIVAKMLPVMSNALAITSDEALLQFAKAKVQQLQEVADSSAVDALSLMSGEVSSADFATQKKISASVSKGTQDAVRAASIKVLNDIDGQRPPLAKDERRFNAIYEQLDSTLKSVHGTSAYYFANDSLKPEVRCRAGLLLYKETLNLAPNDDHIAGLHAAVKRRG